MEPANDHANAPIETPAAAPHTPHAAKVRSRLSRKWVYKMVGIAVFLVGFGVWGLYDALVAYPRRGERASEAFEFDYLRQVPASDLFTAGIPDPRAELARLREKQASTTLAPTEAALERWLDSLGLVGRLDGPTATAIPRTDFRGDEVTDARERLRTLETRFQTLQGGAVVDAPSPLTRWDIPVQWIFVVAGFGGGLWLLMLLAKVRSRSFAYEPREKRLTLADGATLTPADLDDVDKRRWHKFYVTLRVKPSHPTLGGKGVELDLLRYEPVEQWVLEMERAAFPDRIEAPATADPAGERPTERTQPDA